MKKVLKIIVIGGIVIIVCLVGGFLYLVSKPSAPKNYWEQMSTEAQIESKYNSLGSYEIETKKYDAPKDETDKKDNFYQVWYPKEKGTYPLVVMVNGTGVPCNKYESVFEHFASWGYVVIGNNYGTNWDGKHPSETLDFALNNEEISSMIDTSKIAIGGHSQGGEGTFNAVNEYDNGKLYKVIFSISPTNQELGLALKWGFDLDTDGAYAYKLDEIEVPTMILAGTGSFDNDTVSPLEKMKNAYDELNVDKVMFRRSDNVDHGQMLYESNGYIIAWLDYYLKGKLENEKAFFGDSPEIENNSRYQDFKSKKLVR